MARMDDTPATPRRRFQFRLRTLMIGVTLLGILCGTATWVVGDRERLIRERDEALQADADARAKLTEVRFEMTRHKKAVHALIDRQNEQLRAQARANASSSCTDYHSVH
jgi:hypothetical protein